MCFGHMKSSTVRDSEMGKTEEAERGVENEMQSGEQGSSVGRPRLTVR